MKIEKPIEIECPCCDGKGHFSAWGKPSTDPKDRVCMECNGKGKTTEETDDL